MKIIEQSHEIISMSDNLLATIEAAGRTCYKSEDRITDDSAIKFVKMLRNHRHHAMIEFGDIIVRFITNRGVTHELVRHRLCSFAQESTRYVKYSGDIQFIRPVWCTQNVLGVWDDGVWAGSTGLTQADRSWMSSMLCAKEAYIEMIEYHGWKAQQAREVLPNSLKTEIVVKANIREWRHIFTLRTSKAAHPQMRALMLPLLIELKEKLPIVFDDIKGECL